MTTRDMNALEIIIASHIDMTDDEIAAIAMRRLKASDLKNSLKYAVSRLRPTVERNLINADPVKRRAAMEGRADAKKVRDAEVKTLTNQMLRKFEEKIALRIGSMTDADLLALRTPRNTAAPDPMDAAHADGWTQHPDAPGYHYKGHEVLCNADVTALYK